MAPQARRVGACGRKVIGASRGMSKKERARGDRPLLARIGEAFFCVDAACTYSWADLTLGAVDPEKKAVVCPGCGGAFSLETGQPLGGPPQLPLEVYEVHVVDDGVGGTLGY